MSLSPRPYTIEEYTRTVCPHCAAEGPLTSADETFVDGMLVSHQDSIWMRRWCPKHGATQSIYEEDAAIWRSRNGWQTPTLEIIPDRPGGAHGFPAGYREGLPPSHGQHTCILLLNVTENCNYSCPTCYATALPPGAEQVTYPTREEVLHTLDTMIQREKGRVNVVMISGGEPTVRKDIESLLEAIFTRSITRVMLNTNGRRIAKDDRFVEFLKKHRDKVEVYLQFDGVTARPYEVLRGENVWEEKQVALAKLSEAGIFTTLVVTVAQGVNEDQLGAIAQFGMDTPYCAGVAFQPVFGSGRSSGIDGQNRMTPTGVIRRLESQLPDRFSRADFIPLPCSHKDCCDIGYFIRTESGWKSLVQLIGRDELKNWIHLVSNTISFENAGDAVKSLVKQGTLQRVFSEQQRSSALTLAKDLLTMCECVPGVTEFLLPKQRAARIEELAKRTFRVTVKMFMDAHTFHEARIRQCCVHVGTFEEDPRRHSFCWRWMFSDATDFPGAANAARFAAKGRALKVVT